MERAILVIDFQQLQITPKNAKNHSRTSDPDEEESWQHIQVYNLSLNKKLVNQSYGSYFLGITR